MTTTTSRRSSNSTKNVKTSKRKNSEFVVKEDDEEKGNIELPTKTLSKNHRSKNRRKSISFREQQQHRGRRQTTEPRIRRSIDDDDADESLEEVSLNDFPGAIPVRGMGRSGMGLPTNADDGTVTYAMGGSSNRRHGVDAEEVNDGQNLVNPSIIEAERVEDLGVVVDEALQNAFRERDRRVPVVAATAVKDGEASSRIHFCSTYKKRTLWILLGLVLIAIILGLVIGLTQNPADELVIPTLSNDSLEANEQETAEPTLSSLDWCPSGETRYSTSENYNTGTQDDTTESIISGLDDIEKIIGIEVYSAPHGEYAFLDSVVNKMTVTYRLSEGQNNVTLTRGGSGYNEVLRGILKIPDGVYLSKVIIWRNPSWKVVDAMIFCLSDDSCFGPWGGSVRMKEEVLHMGSSVIKAFFGEVRFWIVALGCYYETCLNR